MNIIELNQMRNRIEADYSKSLEHTIELHSLVYRVIFKKLFGIGKKRMDKFDSEVTRLLKDVEAGKVTIEELKELI